MAKQIFFIEGKREGYSIDQVYETITAGELIEVLQQLDEDTPIYLDNDNGYTYGGITDWSMDVKYLVTCHECGEEVMVGNFNNFECPDCSADLYRLTR